MNEKYLWASRKKIVSWFLIGILVCAGLAILLPISNEVTAVYNIPSGKDWDMDDLVANSSGAVTMGMLGDYYVHDTINISFNSSLTVDPGQTVYFDIRTGFNVYGHLNAMGDNVSMITFTSNAKPQSPDDWDGISFFGGTGDIDYVSISYADDGVLIANTSITITNSEFTNNVWGIHLMGGGSSIDGCTFTSNGVYPDPIPSKSWGGGVFADNCSYVMNTVENTDFIDNVGGVRVESSMVHIISNHFSDNTVYGVYSQASGDYLQNYVQIMDNDIMFNEYYGIYTSLGYEGSYMYNNNITHNMVGIHIESGAPGTTGGGGTIDGNYIAYNWMNGIECYGGGADPWAYGPFINGNDILYNNISGIYLEESVPYVDNNEIVGNFYGIYAYDSDFDMCNCHFDYNQYAIWANLSDIQVKDSEIITSYSYDYHLENDAYLISLNTSFNDYAVHFVDGLSTLEVQWYLHILVNNASGPVDSADVTLSDNANGTWSQGYVTNANGWLKWITVTEYIRTLTDWVNYTPHNITACKDLEIGYAEPFMDMSKHVIVDISDGIPPVPPLPPTELDIILVPPSGPSDPYGELELTWSASPDDGSGENDVDRYNIYRADSIDGPYTLVGYVSATGAPHYSYQDNDVGDGEWSNYFYIVRAKDGDGLEDGNENKVGKFVSYLDEGWNMISVPLEQTNTSRETVLQTLENNYVSVFGYHAGKSRPWLHWHRDKPNKFNDVIEINHKEGYYTDMYVADHLVTVGKVAPQTEINLKAGWNLIGYPCLTERLRNDALSSIAGKYNIVEYYDTASDKEVRIEWDDPMMPGLGYWIHATENCVWTIMN